MSPMTVGRPRVGGLPPWVWLVGIVVASAGVRIALAPRVVAPWIMVDELIYSELAKSVAANGHFLIRGVPSNGYGFVYPALIAPAFRLFDSVPRAYAAAKDINAVVMSLAAIPAYLLARRLVSPLQSLVAALLTVAIPSLLYTGTLMTENAFYPLFLLIALLLVLTLERPTPLRQALLLAVCVLGFFTRAQAIAVFPAILVAPALHGLIERDLRLRLRRFVTLYGAAGLIGIAAVTAAIVRGRPVLSVLGAYRAAVHGGYTVSGSLHYVLWHVAELDLYVGVLPFAALLALWLAPRTASPAARAYAAASFPLVVFVLVEVAIFASTQSGRIEERNDFYLVPLMLVALVGVGRTAVIPRVRRAVIAAAVIAAGLPATVPFARFVNRSAVSDTFGLLPWWWLEDRGVALGTMRIAALGVGVVAGVAFVLAPRRVASYFAVLVAAYFVCVGIVVENGRHGIHQASVGSLRAGIRASHLNWIDRAVGPNANVSFLWHPTGETRPLWNNEFFNRSIHTLYTVNGPDVGDGGLPEIAVHERDDGTLASAHGVPRVRYAVSYTDVAGTRVARDPAIGLAVYRVNGPLVVLTRITGLYADTWSGQSVTYRRLRCTGGQLTVRLGTDEHLFATPQLVTATVDGKFVGSVTVQPAEQRIFGVALEPDAAGACSVTFTMKHLRIPARVQPGSTDTRRLGARFLAFEFSR